MSLAYTANGASETRSYRHAEVKGEGSDSGTPTFNSTTMGFARLGNVSSGDWAWHVVEKGAVRTVFRSTPTPTMHSSVALELAVYSTVKRVDLTVRLTNWTNAFGVANRVAFPIRASRKNVSFATPFGVVRVGHDEALQGDMDTWLANPGPEVPKFERGWAQRPREILDWIHAEGEGVGVTIASPDVGTWDWQDASGAYSSESIVLAPEMLIHTNSNQGPFIDESGDHTFHFSIFATPPGEAAWRSAVEVAMPLAAVQKPAFAGAPLASKGSFLEVSSPSIWVTAVKKEHSGNGLIVRMFDAEGVGADASVDVLAVPAVKAAYKTNLIELDAHQLPATNHGCNVTLTPWSIETFLFDLGIDNTRSVYI
eukprot:NODE_12008_length_1252_cov_3.080000.p1 GENE.NODE_12008_length_1252_cov_3.080000~~NODE_12008_length_1252_cov_3.080000.p1  ORF type:complete len:401 (+),score=113.19 NODE_12008_length_1252_cov_3.080000:102-1205(+)